MAYRYCPQCDRWLETAEYTVDKSGETVCPEHIAVHGYIDGGIETVEDFVRAHSWMRDYSDEIAAAKRQGLLR